MGGWPCLKLEACGSCCAWARASWLCLHCARASLSLCVCVCLRPRSLGDNNLGEAGGKAIGASLQHTPNLEILK